MLFVVATPIGNLKDITYRAVEVLKSVDVVACEDTRQTRKLLSHYGVEVPVVSCHQHSSETKIRALVGRLSRGEKVALVTDAGTPAVSDPGSALVAAAWEASIQVVPVPGPSAVTTALCVSGLGGREFNFRGFPPHKKGRRKFFAELAASPWTSVIYESPHRILKTLQSLAELLEPGRTVFVAREMTKKFETLYRGEAAEILARLRAERVRGEFVVIVAGKS